jgi:hypothetical protein
MVIDELFPGLSSALLHVANGDAPAIRLGEHALQDVSCAGTDPDHS